MKIAITVWGNRISPVFDSAHNLLVVGIEDDQITERKLLSFRSGLLAQFITLLEKMEVQVLICGALCKGPVNALESKGIKVVPFMTGKVDAILDVILDQHAPGVPFDQPWRRALQLVGQKQRRFIVPQIGDSDLPKDVAKLLVNRREDEGRNRLGRGLHVHAGILGNHLDHLILHVARIPHRVCLGGHCEELGQNFTLFGGEAGRN